MIRENVDSSTSLKRGIGKWTLVLMIINGIIGAGIFGLPSKVFQITGVYSIAAFFICAAIVLIMFLFLLALVLSFIDYNVNLKSQ